MRAIARIFIYPDPETEQGWIWEQYCAPEYAREVLEYSRQLASVLELKEALIVAGVLDFRLESPGSHPETIKENCTPEMLIHQYLDDGRERWQSLCIIPGDSEYPEGR